MPLGREETHFVPFLQGAQVFKGDTMKFRDSLIWLEHVWRREHSDSRLGRLRSLSRPLRELSEAMAWEYFGRTFIFKETALAGSLRMHGKIRAR